MAKGDNSSSSPIRSSGAPSSSIVGAMQPSSNGNQQSMQNQWTNTIGAPPLARLSTGGNIPNAGNPGAQNLGMLSNTMPNEQYARLGMSQQPINTGQPVDYAKLVQMMRNSRFTG